MSTVSPPPPKFMARATELLGCQTTDPETFYEESGDPNGAYKRKTAKAICARCPFADECRDYALVNGLPGVWGGTTTRERANLRRRLEAEAAASDTGAAA